MKLYAVPLTLKEANAFVAQYHRHHRPVVGHKFSIGAARGERAGGRPKALRECDIAEAAKLKEEGKTWLEIEAMFAKRKVIVKAGTIMRHVNSWRARN